MEQLIVGTLVIIAATTATAFVWIAVLFEKLVYWDFKQGDWITMALEAVMTALLLLMAFIAGVKTVLLLQLIM